MKVLGILKKGYLNPQICLLLYKVAGGEKKFYPYSMRTQRATKEEPLKFILKPLPTKLKYAYLEDNKKCPVVISSTLTIHQEDCLLEILRRSKKAIGWKISYLKGISPLVCTHHIYMEEESKPIRQPQRRLNPYMQEVVQLRF